MGDSNGGGSGNDATTVTGHVTDPPGDASISVNTPISPDIVDVKTIVDATNVTFNIRFKSGSFDKAKDIVTIAVDADQKTTGKNQDGLGIDYYIYMGSTLYGSSAAVMRLTGATQRIKDASVPVTFLSDGMDVTIPLSALSHLSNVTVFNYRLYVSVMAPGATVEDIADVAPGRVDMAPDINFLPASTDKDSINDKLSPVPTTWSAAQIRQQVIDVNINAPNQNPGHIARWDTPIEVNTNNIARVEQALTRYEKLSGGLITFKRVTGTPTNGVVFVEGVAVASDGVSPGCGNVSNVPGGAGVNYEFDAAGVMTGLYYVNLGSTACNDATRGNYESAIAEHEMGHVLGVWGHFDGFTGGEGLMNPNYFNVVYNIYNNPIGTTAGALNILVVSVGQFGFYY
ncbi:MAG: hypothetical protein HZB62_13155 [Nitrospirae bacterium]|nr:hypothetical protein [Nitrospirota bacterium]